MDKVEIIKELGHGKRSVIYLAKYEGKQVIYKITHILQDDIDEKKSRYYAMLKFYEELANKYPNHFLTLLGHKITYDCDFKYEYKIDSENSKEVHQSNICLATIEHPILDTTLKEYYHNLNRNNSPNKLKMNRCKIYSFLVQFNYMFIIMQSKGWQHLDSHVKNIMGMYTNEKYEKVKTSGVEFNIPLQGTRWYLIDYDPMYNKSFNGDVVIKSGAWKYLRNDIHYYLINVIEYTLFQPYWLFVLKTACDWECSDEVYKKIISSSQTSYIKDLLPDLEESETLVSCTMALTILLEPESYMRYRKFDKQIDAAKFDELLQLTKRGQYFDSGDMKFYVKHLDKPVENIKYFIAKIEELSKPETDKQTQDV